MAASLPLVPHAAFRVPSRGHGASRVFVNEAARQALERRMTAFAGEQAMLSVTDNVRAMATLYRAPTGVLQVRCHHLFLDAPSSVQDSLAAYVLHQEAEASQIIGAYIHENGHRIKASRRVMTPLVTSGVHHDLQAVFDANNREYFGGACDALVTWGRRSGPLKRKRIWLGSYSAPEKLIRIHRVLDAAWVPRYAVSFILFHEMLHHVCASGDAGGGRRIVHTDAFKEREQLHKSYSRATAWEAKNLARLLRS